MVHNLTLSQLRMGEFNASSHAHAFEMCHSFLGKGPLNLGHFTALNTALSALKKSATRKVVNPYTGSHKPKDFLHRTIEDCLSYFIDCPDDPNYQRLVGFKLIASARDIMLMHRPFPFELNLGSIGSAHVTKTGHKLNVENNRHFNLTTALTILMSEYLSSAFPHKEELFISLPAQDGLYLARATQVSPQELAPHEHFFRVYDDVHSEEVHQNEIPTPSLVIVVDEFVPEQQLTKYQLEVKKGWDTLCAQRDFETWCLSVSELYFYGGDERFKKIFRNKPDLYARYASERLMAFHSLMDLMDTPAWGWTELAYSEACAKEDSADENLSQDRSAPKFDAA